jgi:UDP-N-acetyl-2-amino-2-deoxyglucuronate dehydrogenase
VATKSDCTLPDFDETLSIGIIGLGGVAQAHLQAFEDLGNLNIISVCDVRPEVVDAVAKKVSATPYSDYRALLAASNIDLAMVLTPASTHREIVEAIAERGIHVFCEKPIAVTMEDAMAMLTACRKARVKFFYGSCYRYLPAIVEAKRLIRSGTIGEVQLMTEQLIGGNGKESYTELLPVHYPLDGPGGSGTGLVDHGIHLIDIFSWLNDSEIVSTVGKGQISGAEASCEFMVMHLANGAIGHLIYNAATYSTCLPNEGMFSGGRAWLIDGTVSDAGLWDNEPGSISIYGTKGSLRIFHYTNGLFINNGDGPQEIQLTGRPAFGHFATQMEDCVAAILEDRDPSVTGEDGVRALKVLLSVYPSKSLEG